MILKEETFEVFGYEVWELLPRSSKPIIAACDNCGKVRLASKNKYHALCRSCAQKGKMHTEGHKANISAKMKGKRNCLGNTLTGKHKAKISASNKGKHLGENNSHYNGGKKVSNARHNAKRKRQLGYTLLMPLEEGEEGHHVTNEYVIGIPKDIHQSIGGSRKKHRKRVLQWLKTNNKKKYKKVLCVLAKEILI
jgi:hypothetical protein